MPILRRTTESQTTPDETAQENLGAPRFEHPKILAVDLSERDVREIQAGGFNVAAGSFGRPMRGERSERWSPVEVNGQLPNATEQEIVVADLASPAPSEGIQTREPVGTVIWQQLKTGELDPRPLMMHFASEYFDRIYDHGGIFVLFADSLHRPRYVEADQRTSKEFGTERDWTNWSLLSALSNLKVRYDLGREIKVDHHLSPVVSKSLERASFTALVGPWESSEHRWITLASSKYGESVGGILVPEKDSNQGFLIVLPRVPEKGLLVRDLLQGLLPRLAPKLFPEDERQAWIEGDLYASDEVVALQAAIAEVKERSSREVADLEATIAEVNAESAHLRELLTATGDELVAAVKKTLEELGFGDIRDVDSEEGKTDGRLHEDLQVHTDSPIVVVEVKGLNGMPSDEDALEVQKYVLARTREWKRTDVRGLTIVNHQRSLPPPDRDPNGFQRAQIENAAQQDVGLLTTWDLYRLARGCRRNHWMPEAVIPLFTERAGSVAPIPMHYKAIGEVVNLFEDAEALAIKLNDDVGLAVGDRIALVGEIDFLEQVVESLQVDDVQVESAPPGSGVGVKTAFSKKQARSKTTVYRVDRAASVNPDAT
jgi:CBS domain-containing protein